MDKLLTWVLALFVVAGGVYLVFKKPAVVHDDNGVTPVTQITNFEECVAAGNPVMESYPRQCSANGKSFTENIGNTNEMSNLIVVDTPQPGAEIITPVVIAGKARGSWFFEAQFPIEIFDVNTNQVIGTGIAHATSDWMTEDFVPFTATVDFGSPGPSRGKIILKKDNPSGLPQNAKELEIPVIITDVE